MKKILFNIILILFSFSSYAQQFTEINRLVPGDRKEGDEFGTSVDVHEKYAIVGAIDEDEDASGGNTLNRAGAAYIFEQNDEGDWIEVQKIVASDREEGDEFGFDVAIHGHYAVVSTPDKSDGWSNYEGIAYVFERDNSGAWNEVTQLSAFNPASGDEFGYSVDIHGDYIAVGARYEEDDEAGYNDIEEAGSVFIFKRDEDDGWVESDKVVASDRSMEDLFGAAVAISGDYLCVGAYKDGDGVNEGNVLNNAGSAYIFERQDNDEWMGVQKIVASDREADDTYGKEVDISGTYAVIAANLEDHEPGDGTSISATGAAYIYEKQSDDTWKEVQKITASDGTKFDQFGSSVSIHGNRALIGARFDHDNASGDNSMADAGSAYLFERNEEGTWSEVKKTVASTRKNDAEFGYDVALFDEFGILAAPGEDQNGAGAAYVFGPACVNTTSSITVTACGEYVLPSGSDTVIHTGTYTDVIPNSAGCDSIITIELQMFLSNSSKVYDTIRGSYDFNGRQLTEAGVYHDTMPNSSGCDSAITLILSRTGPGAFQFASKGIPSDQVFDDQFGNAVSINGNHAIIGAYARDNFSGTAYIFKRMGNGKWMEMKQFFSPDGPDWGDEFGVSVDISDKYAIVGAHEEKLDAQGNNEVENAGAVYIFDRYDDTLLTDTLKLTAPKRNEDDRFGHNVALSGDYAMIAAIGESENADGSASLNQAGAVYVYKRESIGQWVFEQKIVASDREEGDQLGYSMDIDGDNAIVANREGKAYLFNKANNGSWEEVKKFTPANASDIHLAIDGDFGILGIPYKNEDSNKVYFLENNEAQGWHIASQYNTAFISEGNRIGNAVDISGDYAIVGARSNSTDVLNKNLVTSSGAAFLFKRNELGEWTFSQKMVGNDRKERSHFGSAVAIEKNNIIISADFEDVNDNSDAGAVYLFKKGSKAECQPSMSSINAFACGQYTLPSGSKTLMNSGTYKDTLINEAGCDSIMTINLTIGSIEASINQNGNTLMANVDNASYQWIDCNDNSQIEGATSQSYAPEESGNYAVVITQNECSDTSECINADMSTSIIMHSNEHHINIYPNPTKGMLNIDMTEINQDVQIKIKDITGKIIFALPSASTKEEISYNLKSHPAGMYFIEVTHPNGTDVLKVIKK